MRLRIVVLMAICMACFKGMGQEQYSNKGAAPPILMLRAEEDYRFLKDNDSLDFFLKELKFIPLNRKKTTVLTLGGGFRPRVEHFTNENYTTEDNTYYSQRLDVHASLRIGTRVRVFAELYHGLTSDGRVPLESDELDVHQAFVDVGLWEKGTGSAKVRIGRQEIGYGSSRLVGIREGPNMRRSFDMARLMVIHKKSSLDLLYGKEVSITPSAFDNTSSIFNANGGSPTLWGIYYRRPFLKDIGKIDLYYLGFHSNASAVNDVAGEELRHAVGIRSFGSKSRLSYNTELIFQVGEIDESEIFAFNFETDWKFMLISSGWKPTIGLRLDWSSGDRENGDGRIETFNPMFVNPAIYSLAAVNTPANLTSLHPNVTIYPAKGLSIYVDYALFYRTQTADGYYLPPRFIARPGTGGTSRHLGDALGFQLTYELNRNQSFDVRCSYFIAGEFIEETGSSENTFYVAPTMSVKF
ncbi:MAG: alginate export family protein [Bacteroidota bacterium]